MTQQMQTFLSEASIVSRIWARDVSLWSDDKSVQQSITNRLGWLDSDHKPGLAAVSKS
ncbi:MAG: hypothetical protein ACNYPI_08020 [Arenicellales bacterium WSBS_2016_MAG_OTU3]